MYAQRLRPACTCSTVVQQCSVQYSAAECQLQQQDRLVDSLPNACLKTLSQQGTVFVSQEPISPIRSRHVPRIFFGSRRPVTRGGAYGGRGIYIINCCIITTTASKFYWVPVSNHLAESKSTSPYFFTSKKFAGRRPRSESSAKDPFRVLPCV